MHVCKPIQDRSDPVWLDLRVDDVEVSIQGLAAEELRLDCCQRSMLANGEQCWHEGIALLAALSLCDSV